MGSETEQELEDRWWFGLRGAIVDAVEVTDYSVAISFGPSSALTLESEARLRDSPSQLETPAIRTNPDGSIAVSDQLRQLVGQRVLSGVGFKSGRLRLVFDSGAQLTAPAGDAYESWQLTGPSGRLWVSVPGGGIVTFPPATTGD